MNEIIIRPEEKKDYRIVEELTREAFWNLHVPGCDEHLLLCNMRKTEEFIKELDFVAVHNGKIVGNIVYVQTKIKSDEKKHKVLTFGPLSVLPEYQNKGIGSKLVNHTIGLAKQLGYKAIVIYGDPEYYKRFGFVTSKNYQITNKEKKFPAALLVLELYPNALNDIEGIFDEGAVYEVNKTELEEFEKRFAKKEKAYAKSQDRFIELSNKYY